MHGAKGETSEQIQRGLHLSNYDKVEISDRFQNYFSKSISTSLLNANCLYVMDGHTIKKYVKDVLKGKFNFDIQNLNFARSDKEQSCKNEFYVNRTKSIQVDYMNREDRFMLAFLEDLDAKALELKYTNAAYSFIIILPNKRTGLPALESNLISYDPEQIIKKLKTRIVNVTIPKFDIESKLSERCVENSM